MINFAAFILTNGRPSKVLTYDTLREHGYTGPIYLIVDDLDATKDQYLSKYPGEVIVFDKRETARTFDCGDNFDDMRAIIYARNASFKIAKDLGVKYFVQLDDDYTSFRYRFDDKLNYTASTKRSRNLDSVFAAMLEFYLQSNITSLAMAQGGDYIGGANGDNVLCKQVQTSRKAMNSFFCRTDRPFVFVGRVNEDVNTYAHKGSTGSVFLTINNFSLEQLRTQSNAGGMTELYLDSGTYVKSFYSVMYQPSSVYIATLKSRKNAMRLHHHVAWKTTVPTILREGIKKTEVK